jgi:hypothetical protein
MPSDHDPDTIRRRYVAELLRLYVATPGVAGRVRRADRDFAESLFDQGIPLYAVENAFVVAAARRLRHNAFATPLPAIRTIHYFREVIREMLDRPPGPREVDMMRDVLLRST